MKKVFSTIFSLLLAIVAVAQPASGYYDAANNKTGDALRTALSGIIDGHKTISYSSLEDYYPDIDYRLDDHNRVWDIYSTCEFSFSDANCSQKNVCDCWNKEHTVPQSWFGGGSPMVSDLFHVLPTDARVNNFRGNLPYGIVSNHSTPVCNDNHALGWRDGSYFEPVDEFKGDIARIYFYMATRYASNCSSWSGGMFGDGNNGFISKVAEMLLEWHRNDPVSEKEIVRNNNVAKVQKNRNPFVDYPCLAEYIWGEKKGQKVDFSTILGSFEAGFTVGDCDGCSMPYTEPTITKPKGDVNVGVTELNVAKSADIEVRGVLLTAPVNLSISGDDAAVFTLDKTSITADVALAGTTVKVTYTPTTVDSHQATLTLSSTGAADVNITLTGSVAKPHTVTFDAGGGICSVARLMESAIDAGVVLPNATLNSDCSSEGWKFAGWCATKITETTDKPTLIAAGSTYHPTADCTLYAVFAKTEGEEPELKSIKLTKDKFGLNSGYSKEDYTEDGNTFVVDQGYPNGNDIQMNKNKGNGILYNTTEMALESIDLTVNGTNIEYTVYEGADSQPGTKLGSATGTQSFTFSSGQTYFKIGVSGCVRFSSITVNYYSNSNVTTYSTNLGCSGQTGVTNTQTNNALYFVTGNQLCVVDLQQGSTLSLYDCVGRLIEKRDNCSSNETFVLHKGAYILKIKNMQNEQTIKIIR